MKAQVRRIVDGRTTLLLVLDQRNRDRLTIDMPMHINGGDVGLPAMQVVLAGGETHRAIVDQLGKILPTIHKAKQYGTIDNPAPELPLRMHCKMGPARMNMLMLGLSVAQLDQLAAGHVFEVDGLDIGMLDFHVTLAGAEGDSNVVELLDRVRCILPQDPYAHQDHEHQPPELADKGHKLVEIKVRPGFDGIAAYAELSADGIPKRVWSATAGPGYACCTKGMA